MVTQSKKEGGIMMKFTKFMRGILIGMCVLALSGCGISENASSKNNDNAVNDLKNNDKSNITDNVEKSGNTDGDSLIRSSDLQGSVVKFSDSGCIVTPVINEDENTAVAAAPGNENDETNVNISYKTDCIFQKANINITTGKATISDASVSDIKKQTSLLIYGDFEDTHNLTATKIVIVCYE